MGELNKDQEQCLFLSALSSYNREGPLLSKYISQCLSDHYLRNSVLLMPINNSQGRRGLRHWEVPLKWGHSWCLLIVERLGIFKVTIRVGTKDLLTRSSSCLLDAHFSHKGILQSSSFSFLVKNVLLIVYPDSSFLEHTFYTSYETPNKHLLRIQRTRKLSLLPFWCWITGSSL